jgi:hypothetical protein
MGRHVTFSIENGNTVITVYEEGMNHKRIKNTRTGHYSLTTLHRQGKEYGWGSEKTNYFRGANKNE